MQSTKGRTMPIDWKNPKNVERLLTAVYIWAEQKHIRLEYTQIAAIFGMGTSYNQIEYAFRKIRDSAKELRGNGDVPPARTSAPRTPKKPKTPRKTDTPGTYPC
jgi:hypothetical protein